MGDVFDDREDAGRRLAHALSKVDDRGLVVLALPRGGVPVAAAVARELGAPMDVVGVRKLGLPGRPELAVGAIGEGGVRVLNPPVIRATGVTAAELDSIEALEREELDRRLVLFRGERPMRRLQGRSVIVVDDGVATGATARAACEVVRRLGARRVVVAVPVGSPEAVRGLEAVADGVVCLQDLGGAGAVGQAYRDFAQVSDATVVELLEAASVPRQRRRRPSRAREPDSRR